MTTLEYFKGDQLATDVFDQKYKKEGDKTPNDMHVRLAKKFAETLMKREYDPSLIKQLSPMGRDVFGEIMQLKSEEALALYIWQYLENFNYIIPGGSVLAGVGSEQAVSLSNCFFNGAPEDNIDSIIDMAKSMANIGKRRGGTSTDISGLRPKGAGVNNSAKQSSGAVSWMQLYDTIGKLIGQEGRKMAEMISIDVRHPDIEDFILIKQNQDKVTNANISIKFNDEFMLAVENDEDYFLRFPVESPIDHLHFHDFEYNKLYSFDVNSEYITRYIKKVKAKTIWDKVIYAAHQHAEPGLLNWSKIISHDPTSLYSELKPMGTNPCSELPLSELDSCRLICSNLYSLVDNPFKHNSVLNVAKAKRVFYMTQILGDAIVDMEIEAVDKILANIDPSQGEYGMWVRIKQVGSLGRRTGSEITGYADMLAALGLNYGDVEMTKQVFSIKCETELQASIDLAILYKPFPLYSSDVENENGNRWHSFILKNYPVEWDRMLKYGRRNAGISTLGPTGTISIMTGTTSGGEPLFLPYYGRKKKCNTEEVADYIDANGIGFKEYVVIHPKFKEWIDLNYVETENPDRLYEINVLEKLFPFSPWFNNTSNDISPKVRVETQALIQQYISASISSTVNLPKSATLEDVDYIYREAFRLGCKGITVYREGSRSGVLTNVNDKKDSNRQAVKRPKVLEADYYQIKSKGKQYIVLVGLLEDKPYEIFTFIPTQPTTVSPHKGIITKLKRGHYTFDSDYINITDLQLSTDNVEEKSSSLYVSMLLRHGADINFIIKTTKKVDDNISSFSSAMCRVLAKYIDKKEVEGTPCPECGGKLINESGCIHCQDCSYSKCS